MSHPSSTRATAAEDPRLIEVLLLGFPLAVFARAQEHMDGLLREFRLIEEAADSDRTTAPARLLDLVAELSDRFGGLNSTPEAERDAALLRGEAAIDLRFRVPPEARAATLRLRDLLDEVDRYCEDGQHLLSLRTPPEAKRFRDWYLEEFLRQLDGGPARPWSDGVAPD